MLSLLLIIINIIYKISLKIKPFLIKIKEILETNDNDRKLKPPLTNTRGGFSMYTLGLHFLLLSSCAYFFVIIIWFEFYFF